MERIRWNEIEFVKVGNATDTIGKTGLTVLRFPKGACGGLHISGGGPAARESGVLDPTTAPTPVNALVLGGGSAFGLCASDGVIQSLEARDIGFPTAYGVIPIVCQSDIYDLAYGNPKSRPTVQMAYNACEQTFITTEPISGNVGAGTGATVGKVCGMERAMKGGIGYAAAKLGDIIVGAVVVVNAFGNVYERSGHALGGVMDEYREQILDASELMYEQYEGIRESKPLVGDGVRQFLLDENQGDTGGLRTEVLGMEKGNTTIGAIVTNAKFNKGELTKIAMMATNGYARSIRPVGTLSDGDTMYAFSAVTDTEYIDNDDDGNHTKAGIDVRRLALHQRAYGTVKEMVPDVNIVGTLAAELVSDAIEDAMHASRLNNSEFLANIINLHEVKI